MPSSLYFPQSLSAMYLVILTSDKSPYISQTAPLILQGSNDTSWGEPIHMPQIALSIVFVMLYSQKSS